MDCLADTGQNLEFIIIATSFLIVVALIVLLIYGKKSNYFKLSIKLLIIFSFISFSGYILQGKPVLAASSKCTSSTTTTASRQKSSSQAGQGQLALINDTYNGQNYFAFDGVGSIWHGLFSILSNDTALVSDPINPNTIRITATSPHLVDIGPDEGLPAGIVFKILDPDDLGGPEIGRIYLEGIDYDNWPAIDYSNLTGKVYAEFDTPDLPINFNLQFTYTATTISGKSATPASVVVTLPPPGPIVLTVRDTCTSNGEIHNLLDHDYTSTSEGVLVPSTIDLDPFTPGRQTSLTIDYKDRDDQTYQATVSVDDSGMMTFSSNHPNFTYSGFQHSFYWTISTDTGITSSIGTITLYSCSPG